MKLKIPQLKIYKKLATVFENMKSRAYTCVLGSKEKVLENKDLSMKQLN